MLSFLAGKYGHARGQAGGGVRWAGGNHSSEETGHRCQDQRVKGTQAHTPALPRRHTRQINCKFESSPEVLRLAALVRCMPINYTLNRLLCIQTKWHDRARSYFNHRKGMSCRKRFLNSIDSSQASVSSLSLKTHLCSLFSNLSNSETHMETTALSLLSKLITRSVSVEVMLPDPSLAFCLWCLKKGEGSLMGLLITKPK